MSRPRVLGALAAVVLVAATQAAEPPAAVGDQPGGVAWRELRYEAHKWLLGAATTTRLEFVPAASVALREAPGHEGAPANGPLIGRLTSTTDLPFGREEEVTTWFDAATGAALQYEKRLTGRKPAQRAGRFTASGLYVWRVDPAKRHEADRPPETWSKRREGHVAPQPPPPPGGRLVDSYALLYLISAARLQPGGELQVFTVSRERLVELWLVARPSTERQVDYEEGRAGAVRRRSGTVDVVPIEVTARPAGDAPAGPDIDLAFMGLRGTLTVFVEPVTGVPVAIVGRAAGVGEVTVRLEAVTLADETDPR